MLYLPAVSQLISNERLPAVETFDEIMALPALNEDSSTAMTFDEVIAPQ